LKIAVVGIASATMPPNMTDRKEMFLYVELGIVAALDVLGGSLTVQAQLTPNSFVLYPGESSPRMLNHLAFGLLIHLDCHLTGGFALCYWFGESAYAGKFRCRDTSRMFTDVLCRRLGVHSRRISSCLQTSNILSHRTTCGYKLEPE
jgi:hypothetical protein